MPADCLASQSQVCDMLFTVSLDSTGRSAIMELLSKLDAGSSAGEDASRWFAVGFSDDTQMGDDAVFECFMLDDSGSVDLRVSHNSGKSNRVVGDIPESTSVQTSLKNDLVSCSWNQLTRFTVRGKTYDLNHLKYHLMLAKGPFRSGSIKAYHTNRIVSGDPIDVAAVNSFISSSTKSSPSGSQSISLIKAHGIIMTISWLVFASVAILIARHYKNSFSDSTCCGLQVWFFVSTSSF